MTDTMPRWKKRLIDDKEHKAYQIENNRDKIRVLNKCKQLTSYRFDYNPDLFMPKDIRSEISDLKYTLLMLEDMFRDDIFCSITICSNRVDMSRKTDQSYDYHNCGSNVLACFNEDYMSVLVVTYIENKNYSVLRGLPVLDTIGFELNSQSVMDIVSTAFNDCIKRVENHLEYWEDDIYV